MKKSVILTASGYIIWGLQPLYWVWLAHIDPLLNMAMRIIWAALFAVGILAVRRRLPELKALLGNKQKMKFLAPAMLFLLADWCLFIYAVQSGHILDTSLGYFMGPFVVFALSMLVFKEKPNLLMLIAMSLAFAGVAISALHYGRFPLISVALSFLFAIYGAIKKSLKVESVLSIAAETLMMTPLALAFLLLSPLGGTLAFTTFSGHLLFVGAGIVTALPMMLYSLGVLKLPYVMLGFMQYISPTLSLFCGLATGEAITPDKLTTFVFIWAALALYVVAVTVEERKKRAAISAR
jgi:chloramphenicol-sensitive protein RarD